MLSRLRKLLFDGESMRLAGLFLLVKPISMVTQILLARAFGTGPVMDGWVTALFLVTLLNAPFYLSFSSTVIPYFIRLRKELAAGPMLGFQNTTLLLALVPALAWMVALYFLGGRLLSLLSPHLDPQARLHAIRLIRYMVAPGLAVIFIQMIKDLLDSHGLFRFGGTMLPLNRLVMLACVAALAGPLGIYCLPVGYALANLAQLVLMLFYARRKACFGWVRPQAPPGALSRLWELARALVLANILLAINSSIDSAFALRLSSGSVATINYASILVTLGTQLFSLSLVTVMFTTLSELSATGEMSRFSDYIFDNTSRVMRLIVPAALACCVASRELIYVLFQRGAFDAAATERTGGVLAIYFLTVPPMVFNLVLNRAFHALQRTTDRIWLNLQVLVTNFVGNLILVRVMDIEGLALSTVLSLHLHVGLSLWFLHRYRLGLDVAGFTRLWLRATLLGALAWAVYRLSGAAAALDGWSLGATQPGAVVVGACRGAVVVAVFAAGYLVTRRRRDGAKGDPR